MTFLVHRSSFFVLTVLVAVHASADGRVLRWGGDAEGGAPFVEADPRDPSILRGFDVEVAGEIAEGLRRRPEFVQVASYDADVHPYSDLRAGRLDAVLLDNIIAARSVRRTPGPPLFIERVPVATGHYIGVLARENTALRDRINEILRARMRDGTL